MPEQTTQSMSDFVSRVHFTYRKSELSSDLQQGDVLARTDEIVKLLEEVHPHYTHESYQHFLVLTQSCDLVRRSQKTCKSRYITLAAIRPLRLVVERRAQELQTDPFKRQANVCTTKHREVLKSFVERLLNNNEHDYFYLHEDAALSFPESQCAFLRLSISIRASEHYETCQAAKLFSLEEPFKHKLGWLVGNIYSRVDTVDWVPENANANEFENQVNAILDEWCRYEPEEKIKAAQKQIGEDSGLDTETLRTKIRDVIVPSKRERALESIMKVLQKVDLIDQSAEKKVKNLLNSDPELAQLFK